MSKHAVEAYSDVLAAEMVRFGVKVSVIEPGNYNSQIFPNLLRRLEEQGYTTEGSLYKEQIDGLLGRVEAGLNEPEPDDVAEAFFHAMSDDNPKGHYLVVPVQREAEVTIRAAFARLVQINEGHEFSYDRDALVRMLDEALERARIAPTPPRPAPAG